jgi:hypothetical protein
VSDFFIACVAFVTFVALAWAINTFVAYVAIEAVAGHDLNFNEAAGVGILLTAIGSGARVSS